MTTATQKNYSKMANNILAKMNVKMHTAFIEYGSHFDDDKQSRDIYRVTFVRGKSKQVFHQ